MKKQGFTLVELLACLAVLAILSGIVLSNVYETSKKKKEEITTYQEKMIMDAAEAYMADMIDNTNIDCTNTNVLVEKLISAGYLSNEYEKFKNHKVLITCTKKDSNNVYTYELSL